MELALSLIILALVFIGLWLALAKILQFKRERLLKLIQKFSIQVHQ
jgi:hypothetical protein